MAYYSTTRSSPAKYVVILSLNLFCWRLSFANIALSVGVAGDEVRVEVEMRDLDLFFNWVDEQGELSDLSTRDRKSVV